MATSGSVFSQTLQEITNTKLDELSKRRTGFEKHKSSILKITKPEDDAVKRLLVLSDGVKGCFDIKLDKTGKVMMGHTKHRQLETELSNLDRFLDQAKYDPSISSNMLGTWEESLLVHLDMQSLKYEYASLYGQLVTEWLSGDEKTGDANDDDVEMNEAFEDVGNAKKLESRMEWEQTVFEPADVDTDELDDYLNDLFSDEKQEGEGVKNALEKLREATYAFETSISTPNQFTQSSLKWTIQGLISSDLLSDEKREVLKDFEGNSTILSEIADVLNMRIGALSSWAWSSEAPVAVEMTKKISGVYNVRMQQDLLQAIFLQYIGVKWSVFFKRAFRNFRESKGAWKSQRENIPEIDDKRLGYYLGPLNEEYCLDSLRENMYKKRYFMAQLLDHEWQTAKTADGEEEAEYAQPEGASLKRRAKQTAGRPIYKQLASKAARKSAPVQTPSLSRREEMSLDARADEEFGNDEDEDGDPPSAIVLKQNLLHLLSTEITMNKHLHGEITAFHSVFESWNPLLPHETVGTILKYLGVSQTWLDFFEKFLEAPLKFVEDDDETPSRKRRRGTPASHALSDVFGEITLFCLDFAVNKSTSGGSLWRIYDDCWFWSRDHQAAVKAWKTVDEFARITGSEVNLDKTGTVRITKEADEKPSIDRALPEGEIRWGFLRLSPQTGRFEIDQSMVDQHVDELHKQLQDKQKSVLDFIQTWNSYAATFFTSNFGKAANCFGREHVDNMLSTHERIQRQVFSKFSLEGEENVTSVAEYLKMTLSKRFRISDVPDGYLYLPMELGGLDLQSPFISPLQIRDEVLNSSSELLEKLEQAERNAYRQAKDVFRSGVIKQHRRDLEDPDWAPESEHDRDNFLSFEEYLRHREFFRFEHHASGTRPHDVFKQLMKRPAEKSIQPDSSKVHTALKQLQGQANLRGITSNWHSMEPYWRWVAMMYGPEIVDRFGGLNIVDRGLLPMGMVTIFRDKRVKWQG